MRASLSLLKVLNTMLEANQAGEDAYGLDISRRTGVKAGTLYPILDRLESEEWVSARWEDVDPAEAGRPKRRYYRLTGHGVHEARHMLAQHAFGAQSWA